ncbi:MAG TPA: response regulator [Polyangia bacterium]|nr:response regulator [Polyangia bacterium]
MSSILIIDDDLDIRREVSEILREEGLDVMTASNGGEALRLLRSSLPPSVVLLDLMMPGTSGWEFRRVQLTEPALASIPVLVFSSFDNGPRNMADLHAQGFLTKPCSIAELLAAIEPFR